MKEIDAKHFAYHTLTGLYFLWLAVFGTLLGLYINNLVTPCSATYGRLLLLWILLNAVIGTSLYMVIRLFGTRGWLYRFVSFSYIMAICVAIAALATGLGGL